MLAQLAVVAGVVLLTVAVAVVSRRYGPAASPTPSGFTVPAAVDRSDFDHPDRPWLVAVFSSTSCDGCADVAERAAPLASDEVSVVTVSVQDRPDVHSRYRIDGVPTTIIADADGMVVGSFLGPMQSLELWDAVAAARADEFQPPSVDC